MNGIVKIAMYLITIDIIISIVWTLFSICLLVYAKYKDWKNERKIERMVEHG